MAANSDSGFTIKAINFACWTSKARRYEFSLPATATVGDLRKWFADKEAYEPNSFQMLLGYRVLLEDDTVPLSAHTSPGKPIAVKFDRIPELASPEHNSKFGGESPLSLDPDASSSSASASVGSGATNLTSGYAHHSASFSGSSAASAATMGHSTWGMGGAMTTYRGGYGSSSWSNSSYSSSAASAWNQKSETGFVGLSNQGATCYMNSLIQSLFMTPEFRDAVYKWNFEEYARKEYEKKLAAKADGKKDDKKDQEASQLSEVEHFNEWKKKTEKVTIPRQLQKLFAMLQLSDERAVQTKNLTKSFGWTDADSFTQHDVQELCRVLFDALEKALAGTDQANLINELYQGEMKDYVRCKVCNYESARSDKYLDIPLVIKAFGATEAVKSVEEAIRAFIEPEILSGDNKYNCEKCNAKVDAQKGLKFTAFPYLLTLQLKRFDFDLETGRRIKLNDRVSFPEVLNMNKFLDGYVPREEMDEVEKDEEPEQPPANDNQKQGDAPAAGAASSSESTPEANATVPETNAEPNGDKMDVVKTETQKEGAIESGNAQTTEGNGQAAAATAGPTDADRERQKQEEKDKQEALHKAKQAVFTKSVQKALKDGPLVYELYAILIHGGSALGGHYYAYIKNLSDSKWYHFNDSSVSYFNVDQIPETFGDSQRSSYGSNAYMLLYRQVDPKRNISHTTNEAIPQNIRELVNEEVREKKRKEKERQQEQDMVQLTFYYQEITFKIKIHRTSTIEAVLKEVAGKLKLLETHKLEDLQLYQVSSLSGGERPTAPFSDLTKTITDCMTSYYSPKIILRTKEPGTAWPAYKDEELFYKVWVFADGKWTNHELNLPRAITFGNLYKLFETKFGIPADKQVLSVPNYRELATTVERPSNLDDALEHSRQLLDNVTIWVEPALESGLVLTEDSTGPASATSATSSSDDVITRAFLHSKFLKNRLRIRFNSPDKTTYDHVVMVKRTDTLGSLKEHISSVIGVGLDDFQVWRGKQAWAVELANEAHTLDSYMNFVPFQTKVTIKKAKARRHGEVKVNLSLLTPPAPETWQYGIVLASPSEAWIPEDFNVAEVKKLVAAKLKEEKNMDVSPDLIRLREIGHNSSTTTRVFLDTHTVKDMTRANSNIGVQILTEPETKTHPDQEVYWVFRWRPSEFKLEAPTEMTFTATVATLDDVGKAIEAKFGVAAVDLHKCYAFRMPESLLSLPKIDWNCRQVDGSRTTKSFYLTDGDIIIWMDHDEKLKELTKEEEDEIKTNEDKKRKASNSAATSYGGKERHLVIKQADVDI